MEVDADISRSEREAVADGQPEPSQQQRELEENSKEDYEDEILRQNSKAALTSVSRVISKPTITEPQSYCRELVTIVLLGWPNVFNLFLNFLPGLVLLGFLGDDPAHLAAAGSGFMFSNITGFSLIVGSAGGAQALMSQAFGASNYKRCGDLLQRQLAIHAVLCCAIALIWWNTEAILVAAGQPAQLSALTGEYMKWRLLGLPALAVRGDMNAYLWAQRITKAPAVLSISFNLLNLALFPVFIGAFGFLGAPLAISVAQSLQACMQMLLAVFLLPEKHAWPIWSWRVAFSGWRELLALAMPAAVLQLSEWWGWEVNLFFAGLLCDKTAKECIEVDVFAIASNTMVVGFMCHYGFSLAASTLVGNALGAGDEVKAKRTSNVIMALATVIGGLVGLVLVIVRGGWGHLFTKDQRVIDLTNEVLPYVALYIFLDALGPGALQCVLRGMGLLGVPAAITFLAFYICGLPVGLFLAFGSSKSGLAGLWMGLDVAMLVMVVSLLVYLFRFVDWRRLADDAVARSQSTKLQASAKVADDNANDESVEVEDSLQPHPTRHGKTMLGKKTSKYAHVASVDDEDLEI